MLNTITLGDCRKLERFIPDESIDLIFTDPVYERIPDYRWLARTARRVLKPNGNVLVWSGNIGQYEVVPAMRKYLRFRMPFNYVKIAKSFRLIGYSVHVWSTPLLWFTIGSPQNHDWTIDTVVETLHSNTITTTDAPPANTYKWYKGPMAYSYYLERFSNVDDIVWDPYTGSASLPVECKRRGRNFYASEIQPDVHRKACARLEGTPVPAPELLPDQLIMESW